MILTAVKAFWQYDNLDEFGKFIVNYYVEEAIKNNWQTKVCINYGISAIKKLDNDLLKIQAGFITGIL